MNIRNCNKADKGDIIAIDTRKPFLCRECGKPLVETNSSGKIEEKPSAMKHMPAIAGVVVFCLITLIIAYFGLSAKIADNPPEANGVSAPATTILRIHGSNTLGAALIPELCKKYMEKMGAKNISRIQGKAQVESVIRGLMPDGRVIEFELAAHGSSTGFADMEAGKCDIAAASRRVKDKEVLKLVRFGDLRSFACEHIVALDGISVIVHRSNPMSEITVAQLVDIFSGKIDNWKDINGREGHINVYARDENSGTWDTFKSLVLKPAKQKLTGTAKRFESNAVLSDSVSEDVNGIGFTGLPYIRASKALAVKEEDSLPFQPSYASVKSESYRLTRRLYLYTPESSDNKHVSRFVDFVTSDLGQLVVNERGFVDLTLNRNEEIMEDKDLSNLPAGYARLTKRANRVITLRFETGKSSFDNRSLKDLQRLSLLMSKPEFYSRKIILIGHTDNTGSATRNLNLSKQRAEFVEKEIRKLGLVVAASDGFGADIPVASNNTESGRTLNRRVEIFLSSDK